VRKDPLDPNTVVALFEFELLQSFHVKVSNLLLLQHIFRLLNQTFALINHIYLIYPNFTVLKVWQSNSLEILPMPAPQSNTDPLTKLGRSLTMEIRNPSEKLMSKLLKLAYPPSTPL